ncbi:MAG: Spy/CpxP family protein refolding chaperone, partial [Xanthobacteraceae bacterium]|nr:Spy/CpxP family protein refolding chaperone [Xanthobacteraceae bacterium]
AVSPRSTDQPPARQQPTAAPAARGTLRSGVTGPLTWPTALEDVVGFAMWAGEYSERLRGHGIGDVLTAVMVPADALAARIRPAGMAVAARSDARRNAAASSGSPSGSLGVCNMEPAAEDWLVTSIERAIEPNAEQRAALAQLKTAFNDAAVRIRAACRDEASPTSAERLRTMQTMLWAVHDAVTQLRGPIAKLYGTLTAEQRQKFAAGPSAQADPRSMTPQAIARLCGAPQSGDAMLKQAEQALNLNRAQRASLDAFQKKAAEMGQFLMASCLKPVASTPVERIDAAADRLTALIFAASTVNLALNDFYGQLSDEQRAKFDAAVR